MALRIQHLQGPRKGQVLSFGDEAGVIVMGSDAVACQVVIDDARVAPTHVMLRRTLGRYHVEAMADHVVHVDGACLRRDDPLAREFALRDNAASTIQLGEDGPALLVGGRPQFLRIRHLGGRHAGRVLQFGDDIGVIVVGRDALTCQVVIDEPSVAPEHVTIQREGERYVIGATIANPVYLNGRPGALDMYDLGDDFLPEHATLQLGNDGPELLVEWGWLEASNHATRVP